MKKSIFLLAALLAFACTPEEKVTVEDPALSAEETEFSVSNEAQDITVTITSNRDWTIKKGSTADWLDIKDGSFTAPKSGSESKSIKVGVSANTDAQERTAEFFVYSADSKLNVLRITVIQAAQSAFLRVTSEKTVNAIKAEGQGVEITIESNAAWKVELKEGATASVTFSSASGTGNGSVTATVAANAETVAKSATVIVSAQGCEDIEVVLNQEATTVAPEAEITYPESTGNTAHIDPKLISSLGGQRSLFVNSPVEWDAKVAGSSTSTGIVLSKTSGHSGPDTLTVTVGANKDWDNRKAIAIEITPKGGKAATASFEQEKGSILALEMYLPVTKGYWPFEETPVTEADTNPGTGTYTVAGYKFGYKAKNESMFESAYGWRIGQKGLGDYYEFPAIEGKKLKKVSIVDGNAGGVPEIHDAEGKIVSGGANNQCDLLVQQGSDDFKSVALNKMVTWTLTGTKGNTSYRLQSTAAGTMRMRYIALEYVDENTPDEGGDTPAVSLDAVAVTSSIVDGSVFSSLGKGARQIKISTTAKWTAKIASTTTATGAALSATSGEGSATIEVSVGQNNDWDNRKKVDVEVSAEGAAPVTVTLEQEKGSIIAFEFRDAWNKNGIWPFNEAPNTAGGDPGPGAYTCGGYTLKYYTVADCYSESSFGWRIGTGIGNYFDTPAIEGKKLVKMEVYEKNGSPAQVTDIDGSVIVANEAPKQGLQEWVLPDTAAGKSYRYINTTKKTLRFYVIRLFYE